jgi:magnesium transporter
VTAEAALLATFAAEHPIDVAHLLDRGAPEDVAHVLTQLDAEAAGRVLSRMTPSAAADGISELDRERAAEILAEAGPSTAALVLARTSEPIRRATLGAMSGREADAIRRLLLHAAHTAGSVMDALVLCVADDATVEEALALVRAQADSALYYLYIIDREQRLVGVTTLGQLLGASPEDSVLGVMRERPAAILAHATLAAIVAHPGWRLYHALPVVDREGVLLGVIRYDAARAVEREIGRAVRRTNLAETASALAQLYAIGTLGMAEWITALSATRRGPKRQGPA